MKISVIMQSYLHDYPGSRSNPEQKFIRAVNSFLEQTHDDKELIIVADGCSITPEIFYKNWPNDKRLNFAYIHKNAPSMYEVKDGKTLYRGTPRRIGCSLAQGDVITYLDTDDIMLPTHLENINKSWSKMPKDVIWATNQYRWWAKDISKLFPAESARIIDNESLDLSKYNIKENFILTGLTGDMFLKASWAISHRKEVQASWRDSIKVSEDVDFVNQIKKNKGFRLESKTYVVCHYRGQWDL